MSFPIYYDRFLRTFETPDMTPIPAVGVRFVGINDALPDGIEVTGGAPTWCQAVKRASTGEVITIMAENCGCPAAAITFGFVTPDSAMPLAGNRPYTDLMEKPAPPSDFSNGNVYACKSSGHPEYALFGDDDVGRFRTVDAAQKALEHMQAIPPGKFRAAMTFSPSAGLEPEVVILPMTPAQALRVTQAHAFDTGESTRFDVLGLRAVCMELTAIPYLEQRINGSLFCLGARVIARWEGTRLAYGMPWSVFKDIVLAMEESQKGFPFYKYPE
jgi:uncharacterized protein (DUF169 family)